MKYSLSEMGMRLLEKVGSVLADRRFWVTIIPAALYIVYGRKPEDTEVSQWADAIVALIGMVALIAGWSYRPPSGLKRDNEQVVVVKLNDLASSPMKDLSAQIESLIRSELKKTRIDA
jgi:hypothetical protein